MKCVDYRILIARRTLLGLSIISPILQSVRCTLRSYQAWHRHNPEPDTKNKDALFITGDWNAKVGRQEIRGVTDKFGLGIQNEAGQRLVELCQENALVIANTFFQPQKRQLYTRTSPDGRY